MKSVVRLVRVLLVVAGLSLRLVGHAGAAGPPTITKVESQVTVLSDGALDIKYRLTFRETESRGGITTMGRFDPNREMLDYHIEHEGQESPITMNSKGDGYYGVDFGFNTKSGSDYTVYIHYRVTNALDETSIGGEAYRVLEWSPIEWNL